MGSAFDTKLKRVRDFLERGGYGTLVIGRVDNLLWLADADTHVPLTGDAGVAQAVITQTAVTIVCANIEGPRLADEEFAGLNVTIRPVDWWDDDSAAVIAALSDPDLPVASDLPMADAALVSLAPLRYDLLESEVAAYRALGADLGAAVGAVARELERGETEFTVAGRLTRALYDREITPTVILVAADDRIARYRHPIPTATSVAERVMLVACGRRHGLIVALTRLVSFGPLSADLQRRHEAVCAVDAALLGATVPGAQVASIFAAGVAAYAEVGYPDEWRLHHQGGATGYAGRDYKGTFACGETVHPWQAFAWNPSITGTKSEDTMLATPTGPEIISASPDWPLAEYTAAGRRLARPAMLVR